jgi:hypothetical protein
MRLMRRKMWRELLSLIKSNAMMLLSSPLLFETCPFGVRWEHTPAQAGGSIDVSIV